MWFHCCQTIQCLKFPLCRFTTLSINMWLHNCEFASLLKLFNDVNIIYTGVGAEDMLMFSWVLKSGVTIKLAFWKVGSWDPTASILTFSKSWSRWVSNCSKSQKNREVSPKLENVIIHQLPAWIFYFQHEIFVSTRSPGLESGVGDPTWDFYKYSESGFGVRSRRTNMRFLQVLGVRA